MKQSWNAKKYIDNASFVANHGNPVVDLLAPTKGEKILDLGCGDGALTSQIETCGAHVHGVDASPSMVDSAINRGLSAEVGSGDSLTFKNEFDAVFSNAALHWMVDYESVIGCVYAALKPNGRFIGEFGGEGNVHSLVQAMEKVFSGNDAFGMFVNPWFFPTAEFYKAQLEKVGFKVNYIELIPRPTPLTSGVSEWLKLFANGIVSDLTEDQKNTFLEKVETLVKPDLFKGGEWVADYVRLRFSATKV